MNTKILSVDNIPTTAEAIQREGFGRIDGLMDEAERASIGAMYDDIFADPGAHPNFMQLGGTDANGNQLMPQVLAPHQTHPQLLTTGYYARVEMRMRQILGPQARMITSHMILKPAGSPRDTPWHQDQAYHNPEFIYTNINVWLPLDGADIDDGCMWYVPRSHTGPIVPHTNCGADATAVAAQDQDYWQANAVPVPLPPGSASLHASYCLHYAGPNRSPRPRRAWILVFGLEPQRRVRPLVLPWQAERVAILGRIKHIPPS